MEVICGVIWNCDRIFCARKKKCGSNPGLWELPGGKLEFGETHDACLKRELLEELNLSVEVGAKFGSSAFKDSAKTIHLLAYHAQALGHSKLETPGSETSSTPESFFDFRLVDHDQWAWMEVWRLGSLQWAPADVPLIQSLMAFPRLNPFDGTAGSPLR